MKNLIKMAAALAAFSSASIAFAQDAPSSTGHYEWQSSNVFGVNKSSLPSRVRVWVKDVARVANCDCAMMNDAATLADCMAMPHKGTSASHG